MTAIDAEACPHCRGAGAWWGALPLGGAGIGVCVHCQASGEVCACLECGCEMPEPEVFRAGQFCGPCRVALDAPEMAAAS